MRRRSALAGMVVVVVAGLAWLTWDAQGLSSPGLAWVERSPLREIIIQRSSTEFEIHYLRVGGKWALSNPPGYFLDRLLAQDITKAIQDLRLGEPFIPTEPLEAYGLGLDAWRIVTRSGDDEIAFRLGEGGPTNSTYIKVEGEDEVYPSGQWLVSRIDRPVESFVDKRLSHSTPDNILGIRLETTGPLPGVSDPERPESGLVLEIKRQPDGEWRDMLTDVPLSTRRVESLLNEILTLEGRGLYGSGLVSLPEATISLTKVAGEEAKVAEAGREAEVAAPETIRFGRVAGQWAAWGIAPFGYLMGEWALPDLPLYSARLARLQLVEFNPFSDYAFVLPDGTNLAYTREASDPAAVALALVLRASWDTTALEPAQAPDTPGLRLAVARDGNEPFVLALWPNEGIATVGSAAGTWRLAPEWWELLAATGAADG